MNILSIYPLPLAIAPMLTLFTHLLPQVLVLMPTPPQTIGIISDSCVLQPSLVGLISIKNYTSINTVYINSPLLVLIPRTSQLSQYCFKKDMIKNIYNYLFLKALKEEHRDDSGTSATFQTHLDNNIIYSSILHYCCIMTLLLKI